MEKSIQQFASLGSLLDAAEAYVGTPYIWGVYNILVLPPSFPYGGMENPLMTFYNSALITDNKALLYVAIHEICHSWTGNQVTMKNWEDFWLNEGFTTFIERHVSARLYGGDFAKVEALVGNTSMVNDMDGYGYNNTFSSIHPVLFGDNPDNSISSVPYDKGAQFLQFIENTIGVAAMQKFIKYYIESASLQSITSFDMQRLFAQFVEEYFDDPDQINELLGDINWSDWKYVASTDPTGTLNFETTNSKRATKLALDYITLGGNSSPVNYQQYNYWYSNLKVVFL
jgi:leukotriene-A4 hydrolase